ncbi:hypothetical protein ACSSWA_06365 [Melioribacter sp. Ez-97]|uniref:hypothetical protein n=1 Tax=Melioribacter sp. Ez-97 TaxID=3423434 RepID=UPI003EDA955B
MVVRTPFVTAYDFFSCRKLFITRRLYARKSAVCHRFFDCVGKFFSEEFALTLLFNLGVVFPVCSLSNLQRMYGMPAGYFVNVLLAVTSGLVSGTNSFAASDLRQFNALDGAALGMSIGGIEMTAYVLAISATAGIGIYDYTLREWKGIKIKSWREIRLSGTEIFCFCLGVQLLVAAAYRETVMALNV